MSALVRLFPSLCLPLLTFAQSQPAPPRFDIATVSISPRADWVKSDNNASSGGYLSGDRYEFSRATMLDLIGEAWNIDANRIYGGPSWIDYDRFEVAAKTKPGTRPDELRIMLRSLLEDRFGLTVSTGMHPVPGYRLVRGKGDLKLRPGSDAGTPECHSGSRTISGQSGRIVQGSMTCRDANMDAIAAALGNLLTTPISSTGVINATGVDGTWDMDLDFTEPPGDIEARSAAIADAVAETGLVIEKGEVPQPSVTVLHVNQAPAPDPDGAAMALVRPAPEFEVASVRLATEGPSIPLRVYAGGRITAQAMAPAILIQRAWNLFSYRQIVGLPKSFSGDSVSANITIVAKAPEGLLPDTPGEANRRAQDTLNAMLRELLTDRYQMKFHFEQRTSDTVVLTATRPRFSPADPKERTGCHRDGQQQSRTALIVKVSCRNMTMAQFADQLQSFDSGIVFPAEDATGLKGSWDFAFSYDALARYQWPGAPVEQPATEDQVGRAADPTGSVSFLDAIQKQLGLKVETRKRPARALVIDRMLDKPLEN